MSKKDLVDLRVCLLRANWQLRSACALLPKLLERTIVASPEGTKIQRQVRLGEADITKLVDDYRSGITVAKLSRRYGIHRTTVMDHLRRRGVPKQGPKLSREQIAQAKYLRKMGMSYQKIGGVFGVDGGTVADSLHRAEMR